MVYQTNGRDQIQFDFKMLFMIIESLIIQTPNVAKFNVFMIYINIFIHCAMLVTLVWE